MQSLNSEGHDESQYLPRDTPPVNPYRAQHKGIRWEGKAIKNIIWLPEILFEKEIITKEHLDTASSFFRILVHAKRTLGICDIRGPLFDKAPSGVSNECDMFIEIHKKLPKSQTQAIIWFVWDEYNRGNHVLAYHLIGTIKHGLENAQICIDLNRIAN